MSLYENSRILEEVYGMNRSRAEIADVISDARLGKATVEYHFSFVIHSLFSLPLVEFV